MPSFSVMGLHARSGTGAQLRSLESKAQAEQGLFFLRPLSLACRWHLLSVSSPGRTVSFSFV